MALSLTARDSTAPVRTALGVAMCLMLCAPMANVQAFSTDNIPVRAHRSMTEREALRVLLAQVEDAARQMHRHSLGWQSMQMSMISTHSSQAIDLSRMPQSANFSQDFTDCCTQVLVHLHNLPPPADR